MDNALITIKSLYDGLSDAQKQLADFILKNPQDVPFLSIHTLAQRVGISVASISRFARALGFDDIKELKLQLGREVQATYNTIYQSINPHDGDEQIIDKVFSGNIRSLEDTLKVVNRLDLIKGAKAIARAKRVVFFGIGSSGYLAQDAALRFSQIGFQAEAYIDSYQMLSQAFRLKKNDVAMGISHSGRSSITVKVLELSKKNGALTLGISNYAKSPLRDHCKIFLSTSFPESRVKVAALSSRAAQMCLIDALYLLVARYTQIDLDRMEKLNNHTEELLRLSPR